jgi:hypothetical protein
VYRLATAWATRNREFESRWGRELFLLDVFQIGSGAYPALYPMDIDGAFTGVKRPGLETYGYSPASVKVRKETTRKTETYVDR